MGKVGSGIDFTAIGGVAVTVFESLEAVKVTGGLSTARGARGGGVIKRACEAALTAVFGRVEGLTVVSAVSVAVAKARRARLHVADAACAGEALRAEELTGLATGAAVRQGDELGFAAVAGVIVAVSEACGAGHIGRRGVNVHAVNGKDILGGCVEGVGRVGLGEATREEDSHTQKSEERHDTSDGA